MRKKHQWPYTNLLLNDLPGETWEDIPGYEGEYLVSSYGRVKSLRRWRNSGPQGKGYYTKEKIRKQGVRRSANRFLNNPTYSIGITFKRNGRSISTSTARYVYYAFVEPFDLEDRNINISYKDCEGRNLHYKNLFLTDRSGLALRSFRLKRSQPTFSKDSVPVRQLTMDGKLIASYASFKEAQDKTGIILSAIAACVDGRIYQSHGFIWESPAKEKTERLSHDDPKHSFNELLWRRLGKPRTLKRHPIAALNLSPKDMEGEQWKKLEGTDGHYQISNYGRIKRCAGFKNNQPHVWAKELIKRLTPDGNADRPASCLLTSLSIKGKKDQQSVARLVYYHFVKKFDLSDKKIKVRYKNGKCYDLHWKNLHI